MGFVKVEGKNKGSVKMYTLSTCIWCKKTKQFLAEQGVEYQYADLDIAGMAEKDELVAELKKWNPSCSLPTVVIDDSKCIVGFREHELREALGL